MRYSTETHDKSYIKPGMRLRLPEDYATSELPDWRAALFTLILPFPVSGLPPTAMGQRFVDLPESWLPGRFRGIQTIETPVDVNGIYRAPRWERDREDVYNHTPRAFHETATARFKGPLAESVGSNAVDRNVPGLFPSSCCAVDDTSEDLRCHRYLFSADTYTTVSPRDGDIPADRQPTTPESAFNIKETTGSESSSPSHASVRLVCAEFLQYRGMMTHRDENRENGTTYPIAGELAHDYLVLHVLAENCTSESLEHISQSLHRARHTIQARPCSDTANDYQKASLLDSFVADAVTALNDGRPDQDRFTASASKSGALSGGYTTVPSKIDVQRHPHERPVRLWRNGIGSRPVRVVCAVPGKTLDAHSELLGSPFEDEVWQWCPEDLWGWILGSGADKFAEGIPRYSSASPDNPDRSVFEYWTLVPTHHGAALVRNSTADAYDSRPWMLAGTRLTDLAILIHRASAMLTNIGERLRSITLASSTVASSTEELEDLDDAIDELTSALTTFRHIQSDFVRFRDRLWFEVVPDRDLDTEFMLSLRESLGVTRRYLDVKDELELRESVYSVQFNQRQVELDRRLQQQAKAEAEDRRQRTAATQQERDAETRRQASQDRFQNVFLSVLAVALGVPGVVQVSGADGAGSVWLTLALMAIVGTVIFLILRWYNHHDKG